MPLWRRCDTDLPGASRAPSPPVVFRDRANRFSQWNEGRIIALLVLAGVLLIGFTYVQVYLPKTATIAPRIFIQRSILAGAWATLCIGSAMMIFGVTLSKARWYLG